MRLRLDLNNTKQSDLKDIFDKALLRSFHSEIRRLVGKAIDKEMHHLFRYISSQAMGDSNFSQIAHGWWAPYTEEYKEKKDYLTGHQRWFSFGYDKPTYLGTPIKDTLSREFANVSLDKSIQGLGSTRVTIARDLTHIDLRLAPNIRWRLDYLEEQLLEVGLISQQTHDKLVGRSVEKYRPMVGYVFAYFRQARIPRVVRQTLKMIGS